MKPNSTALPFCNGFDGWIEHPDGCRVCVDCGGREPDHRDGCVSHAIKRLLGGRVMKDQVVALVGRMQTAFAPTGDRDDAETLRKAEWVVYGVRMPDGRTIEEHVQEEL